VRFLWKPHRAHPSMKYSAKHFVPRMQRNALRDPQIPPEAKTQVRCYVSRCVFCRICTGPTRGQKIVCQRLWPGHPKMNYVTRRSYRMQNTQVWCNVSRRALYGNRTSPTRAQKIVRQRFTPGCTGMHYVTRRSPRMQKQKFGITCPGTLCMETALVPLEHEK
jgi:hypothetical protein